MISGLNHLTLTVSDLDRSLSFYQHTLGMTAHVKWQSGAYLSADALWLCLSLGTPKPASDYTHCALSVSQDDFEDLRNKLLDAGVTSWQENISEGNSFYFLDPDGHQLEIHVGDLVSRLRSLLQTPYSELEWLDEKPNAE